MTRHGWVNIESSAPAEYSAFIVSAAGAVPASIAARIGICDVELLPCLDPRELTSQWSEKDRGVQIALSIENAEPHDVALEFLYCLGQALWDSSFDDERAEWLSLLGREFEAGVEGDIDEYAFEEKQGVKAAPGDAERLERYTATAFAATAAEYMHTMWHDVTLRTGPEHLPADAVRARFDWFRKILPPNPGQDAPEKRP